VTLEKEPTVLQRIELRFSQKGSKSVSRSNCVANDTVDKRRFSSSTETKVSQHLV